MWNGYGEYHRENAMSCERRNHNFVDLTGRVFGKLTVNLYVGKTERGNSLWRCACECGGECVTKTSHLTSGKTTSCGCVGRSRLALGNPAAQVIHQDGRIELSGGVVCIVDVEDLPLVSQFNWHAAKSKEGLYYARQSSGQRMLMHVLLMGEKGIDHKNGNGLDNRRENLRRATRSQNCVNAKKLVTSRQQYKGITPPNPARRERYWRVRLTVNGKQKSFGQYTSAEEAARAYDVKAKEVYGEFARLNFPEAS